LRGAVVAGVEIEGDRVGVSLSLPPINNPPTSSEPSPSPSDEPSSAVDWRRGFLTGGASSKVQSFLVSLHWEQGGPDAPIAQRDLDLRQRSHGRFFRDRGGLATPMAPVLLPVRSALLLPLLLPLPLPLPWPLPLPLTVM
jgi:hypothetical protein